MIFITATDTDVGKTFLSKLLIEFLIEKCYFQKNEIAYFKPVQCGVDTDFDQIKNKTGVDVFCNYNLSFPASPDYASKLDNQEIDIKQIKKNFLELKQKYKYIVVEGAGGVAVPLNKKELISDLILALDLATVLVIRPDLGTINHTLISFEHLQRKSIKIKGLYVSDASREISRSYKLSITDRLKQNSAALESILRFTGSKILELKDLVHEN